VKDKKVGYSIIRMTSSLEEKYKTEIFPEKKKLYPVDFLVSDDKLYVLEFRTPDYTDYFEYHVASFNLDTGELIGRNQLQNKDGEYSVFATFLKLNNNKEVITGGMYFKGNRTKAANSNGFFTSIIDGSSKIKSSYISWKSVQDKG